MIKRMIVALLFSAAFVTASVSFAQVKVTSAGKTAATVQTGRSVTDSTAGLRNGAAFDSPQMRENYSYYSTLAMWIFVLWLVLIVVYYVWAIHRYNINYGLSNKEWKILYPDIYARSEKGRQKFSDLRGKIAVSESTYTAVQVQGDTPDASPEAGSSILSEPKENPYKADSFGLPPGTIRGTIALTLLVMVLLVEGVNYFAPPGEGGLEGKYSELFIAFEMALAFYFGSRAVQVFTEKSRAKSKEEQPSQPEAPPEPQPPGKTEQLATAAAEPLSPETAPSEAPAVDEKGAMARIVQLSETMRNLVIPEGAAPASLPSLHQRILSLTASFETGLGAPECFGSVTGNFDRQGLSFGVLQYNINQGSLQPLWIEMRNKHDDALRNILGDRYDKFSKMLDSTKSDQMKWALGIQHTEVINGRTVWKLDPDWLKCLHDLGVSQEMIDIQVENAGHRFGIAQANCGVFKLSSDRALALMFDINVQNGKVDVNGSGVRINQDYMAIPLSVTGSALEERKMEIVARRRAEVCNPRWRSDVLARKLTIALGKGRVHGKDYDTVKEYGLTSDPKV